MLMLPPVLSIIIPVYKTEKFLNRCIDSVLAQNLKDCEIILVDDGSPDLCPTICDKYAKMDPRIIVIHKENQGLGMARNSGLKHASGKFLTFLDSDDFVDQHYYEELLKFAVENNLDICVAGYYIADTGRKQKKINTTDNTMTGAIFTNQDKINSLSSKVICPDFDGRDFFSASACFAIFKSSILIDNNLRFDSEKNFLSEDLKFTMNLFPYCKKVGISEVGGYHYWYNENSLSRGYNPNRFFSLKATVKQLELLCTELGLKDYVDRVALYFWVNFEKCLNQEVRYRKLPQNVRIANLRQLCEDDVSQKHLYVIIQKNGLKGLQKILCILIYNKKYLLIDFLLRFYNFIKHR